MNISTGSITAQQRVITNISRNLAGASDPTYTATDVKLVGDKYGVQALPEQRISDPLRTEDVRLKVIGTNYLETMNGVHDEIMRQMGQPGDESSLGSRLTKLKTKLSNLQDAPGTSGHQRDVLGSLQTTTAYINKLGNFFQEERKTSENGIEDATKGINVILGSLEKINQDIAVASGRAVTTADLEDKQDSLLKELSQFLDIRIMRRDSKSLDITTAAGEGLLLPSGARELSFTKSTSIGPADDATVLGKITVGGKDITGSISSGKLGAYIKARDTILPNMQTELDEFTEKFRDQFNAIHNQGTPFPPSNSITGTTTFANPATDTMEMNGIVRIGILDKAGNNAVAPIDLDLTAGAQDINTVVAQINTALGANGSATLTNGQLVVTAANPENGIGFVSMTDPEATEANTGKGFSHFFGMNDLFVSGPSKIGMAQTLAVHPNISAEASLLSRGSLSTTANLVGENALQIGDASNVTKMLNGFEQALTFTTAGPLTGRSESIVNYANSIWHNAAIDAKNNQTDFNVDKAVLDDSEKDLRARTGVNMHEQISKLLEAQQVMSASMRCLQANKEMFDQLIRSI